jgi:hypothetical protein
MGHGSLRFTPIQDLKYHKMKINNLIRKIPKINISIKKKNLSSMRGKLQYKLRFPP